MGLTRKQWFWAGFFILSFYPLRWMLVCLQVQSLITVFLVASIWACYREKEILVGILVGLACCLKPHFALLAFFAIFRKRWNFLISMLLCSGAVVLASVLFFGFSPWRTYLTDIMPVISSGYAFYPNQSVNGIVHRWLGHPPVFEFMPFSKPVFIATWTATLFFAVLALWPRSPILLKKKIPSMTGSPDCRMTLIRALDLALAVLCITLMSPIAWEHHYAWTIVLFVMIVIATREVSSSNISMGMLSLAFVLLGTYWLPVTTISSGLPSLINAVPFAAAIVLLGVGWRTLNKVKESEFSSVGEVWLQKNCPTS
jgi:hypothetical protein